MEQADKHRPMKMSNTLKMLMECVTAGIICTSMSKRAREKYTKPSAESR